MNILLFLTWRVILRREFVRLNLIDRPIWCEIMYKLACQQDVHTGSYSVMMALRDLGAGRN